MGSSPPLENTRRRMPLTTEGLEPAEENLPTTLEFTDTPNDYLVYQDTGGRHSKGNPSKTVTKIEVSNLGSSKGAWIKLFTVEPLKPGWEEDVDENGDTVYHYYEKAGEPIAVSVLSEMSDEEKRSFLKPEKTTPNKPGEEKKPILLHMRQLKYTYCYSRVDYTKYISIPKDTHDIVRKPREFKKYKVGDKVEYFTRNPTECGSEQCCPGPYPCTKWKKLLFVFPKHTHCERCGGKGNEGWCPAVVKSVAPDAQCRYAIESSGVQVRLGYKNGIRAKDEKIIRLEEGECGAYQKTLAGSPDKLDKIVRMVKRYGNYDLTITATENRTSSGGGGGGGSSAAGGCF